MKLLFSSVVVLWTTTILTGCMEKEQVDAPIQQAAYSFEGSIDPALVGDWHTDPDVSGLTMSKDGSLGIVAVISSPTGKRTTTLSGSWLVSKKNLLLKYSEKKGEPDTTLKYTFELSGDTLKLVQEGNGVKTTYHRK